MRKKIAKGLVAALLVSLIGTCGASDADAARNRKPRLDRKIVVVGKKKRVLVHTVNVRKKTKVKIKQSAKSKRIAKVVWKKRTRVFEVTGGKKLASTTVRIQFTQNKKKTQVKLKIRVWECRLPHRNPVESAAPSSSPTTSAMPSTSAMPTTPETPPTSGEPVTSSETPPTPTSPALITFPPSPNKPTTTPEYDGTPVKDIYQDYFLVGAAINGNSGQTMALNHAGMADILKTHFNSTTMSNLMKPVFLLDQEASKKSEDGMPVCKFDTCDPALQFCQENGIKMRGHTLVWHNQTPEWFFFEDYDTSKGLVDAATMEARMDSYFRQVITHCQDKYPGVVYCWDVVNECVCTDADSYVVTSGGWKLRSQTKSDNDFSHEGYVPNFWYATIGESYVEKAFACARKYADPDVKLFYNDYNVFMTDKMNNIYTMVSELKDKGVIDGIGLQPTVLIDWPKLDSAGAGSFRTCLEKYAELGLELQITELSFKINGGPTEANQKKQSDRYEEFMRLLLEEDSDNGGPCNITSVTVFGICDDYPLYENFSQNLYLWDKYGNPKSCFFGFIRPGQQIIKEKGEG